MAIDIHSHCLYGVDDGARTLEESVEMIRASDGVTDICATPHLKCGTVTEQQLEEIRKRFRELKEIAEENGKHLHLGCELMLNSQVVKTLREGLVIPLGGKYLLCEFDVRKPLTGDEADWIHEVKVAGYIPVLAHPERYESFDAELFLSFGYAQINASSFLDGGTLKKNAIKMLKGGAVAFASDMHRVEGRRSPRMAEAEKLIGKKYGTETADRLFYTNPGNILKGAELCHQTKENTAEKPGGIRRRIFRF